jgi:hypothetical protein
MGFPFALAAAAVATAAARSKQFATKTISYFHVYCCTQKFLLLMNEDKMLSFCSRFPSSNTTPVVIHSLSVQQEFLATLTATPTEFLL